MHIPVITSLHACSRHTIAAGILILLILTVNIFAQDLVTARIPVTVNVGATVSIQPSAGVAGEGVTREVEANKEEIFEILFDAGSVSVLQHQQRQRSEFVSYGRGRVSLKLPQTYVNADIALHTFNGKRILNGKAGADVKITHANVPAGIYLLAVKGKGGNTFSTKLTHNGGKLNIDVTFVSEVFLPLYKSANSATVGTWTITTTLEGYKTDVRTFIPEAKLNPAQNITLSAVQNLCEGFVDGTEREHHGKMKPQFCDKRDGQKYVYVTIGNQVWMAENLNFARDSSWCYENSADSCDKYGRLYKWDVAMTTCPSGWRLPDTVDWHGLFNIVGGSEDTGIVLKSAMGWYRNYNGTDEFGFSALPGGYRRIDGFFNLVVYGGFWWSATEENAFEVWGLSMSYFTPHVHWSWDDKSNSFSVRCVSGSKP